MFTETQLQTIEIGADSTTTELVAEIRRLRGGLAESMSETLNRAFRADPAVMNTVCHFRRHCNKAMADDPTIIVRVGGTEEAPLYTLGLVGLLNGIIEDAGCTTHRLAFKTDDDDTNQNVIGFCAVPVEAVEAAQRAS